MASALQSIGEFMVVFVQELACIVGALLRVLIISILYLTSLGGLVFFSAAIRRFTRTAWTVAVPWVALGAVVLILWAGLSYRFDVLQLINLVAAFGTIIVLVAHRLRQPRTPTRVA